MRRRELLAALGGAVAWPITTHAQQQGAMPVIGYVSATTIKLSERVLANYRRGLAEYGYVEGQNFRFEFREANFQNDRLSILFRELVDLKVAVIIADSTAKIESAKVATQSIPIVFNIGSDPVENGYVASLNKPGGNITGIFNFGLTLTGKQLEILHELIPSATKFAFLTDQGNITLDKLRMPLIQAAADSLGLGLLNVKAHTPDEFEAAFDTAVRGGAGGMIVGSDGLFIVASTRLAAVAARYRLPTIYFDDLAVKTTGLIGYGSDLDEFRLVGTYAARILKGEKPADMPVQQATRTILIINLKTAKTLGITVPNSLLSRADQVIE
jgi:putative ABC transport system substrate-binding protein